MSIKSPSNRACIRRQIIPFNPSALTFCVGWSNNLLTFEQITESLRPKIAQELLGFRKMERQYLEDLLQQGWLRLWQALQDNPRLLAEKTLQKSANFVTNRCGTSTLLAYLRRYDRLPFMSQWQDPHGDAVEDCISDLQVTASLQSVTGKTPCSFFPIL